MSMRTFWIFSHRKYNVKVWKIPITTKIKNLKKKSVLSNFFTLTKKEKRKLQLVTIGSRRMAVAMYLPGFVKIIRFSHFRSSHWQLEFLHGGVCMRTQGQWSFHVVDSLFGRISKSLSSIRVFSINYSKVIHALRFTNIIFIVKILDYFDSKLEVF